jgi:hypothetical protein
MLLQIVYFGVCAAYAEALASFWCKTQQRRLPRRRNSRAWEPDLLVLQQELARLTAKLYFCEAIPFPQTTLSPASAGVQNQKPSTWRAFFGPGRAKPPRSGGLGIFIIEVWAIIVIVFDFDFYAAVLQDDFQ